MPRYKWDGWFSIDFPDGWEFTEEDATIGLYKAGAEGVGALQISVAWRTLPDPVDLGEPIRVVYDFAHSMGWSVTKDEISLCRIDRAPASVFSYDDTNGRWQVWHIFAVDRMARITYNSDRQDFELERREREAIVKSFRWEPVEAPS